MNIKSKRTKNGNVKLTLVLSELEAVALEHQLYFGTEDAGAFKQTQEASDASCDLAYKLTRALQRIGIEVTLDDYRAIGVCPQP